MRRGRHVFKIHDIAKHLRIRVLRVWYPLRYKNGIWKMKLSRRRKPWKRIQRRGRQWFVRYKGRLKFLRRNFSNLKIIIGRRSYGIKHLGGRGKYIAKIGRAYRILRPRYTWRARYKGKTVLVRRRGKRASIRVNGKWSANRRLRFPRRKYRRGKIRIPLLLYLSS